MATIGYGSKIVIAGQFEDDYHLRNWSSWSLVIVGHLSKAVVGKK